MGRKMMMTMMLLVVVVAALFAVVDGSDTVTPRTHETDYAEGHTKTKVIVGVGVGIAVLLVLALVVYFWYRAHTAPPVEPPVQPERVDSPLEIELFPLSTAAASQVLVCGFCVDPLEEGETLRTFPCSHVVHDACMVRGLSSSRPPRVCPSAVLASSSLCLDY